MKSFECFFPLQRAREVLPYILSFPGMEEIYIHMLLGGVVPRGGAVLESGFIMVLRVWCSISGMSARSCLTRGFIIWKLPCSVAVSKK